MNHVVSAYIDDLYLQSASFEGCVHTVVDTITLFDNLGFVIHPEKSQFIPKQQVTFLGFVIDSITMRVYLTDTRRLSDDVKKICQTTNDLSIEFIAQIIGYIVSSLPAVQYGALYYRWLEKDKTLALKLNKGNFKGMMSLCDKARNELQWCSNNITTCYNNIVHAPITATVYSDASLKGWGAAMNDTSTGGQWSDQESTHHINYLELLAAFRTLKVYQLNLSDQHIKIMIDNTAAVGIINNMGTCRSDDCHTITVKIWEFCAENNLWFTAAHLPGSTNVTADSESRGSSNEPTSKQQRRYRSKVKCTVCRKEMNSDHFSKHNSVKHNGRAKFRAKIDSSQTTLSFQKDVDATSEIQITSESEKPVESYQTDDTCFVNTPTGRDVQHSQSLLDKNVQLLGISGQYLEPYPDEPLAYADWIQQYECDVESAKEEETLLQQRLEGNHIIEYWCKCGHCKTEKREGPAECKCCEENAGRTTALFDVEVVEEYGKVPECVTLHPGFDAAGLSKWTLRLACEKYRTQLYARYARMTSELKFMRAVAYRQFTQLVHGRLGEKRIPLPACAYHVIRTKFPTKEHAGFHDNNCSTEKEDGGCDQYQVVKLEAPQLW
eukprot:gene11530-12719_t